MSLEAESHASPCNKALTTSRLTLRGACAALDGLKSILTCLGFLKQNYNPDARLKRNRCSKMQQPTRGHPLPRRFLWTVIIALLCVGAVSRHVRPNRGKQQDQAPANLSPSPPPTPEDEARLALALRKAAGLYRKPPRGASRSYLASLNSTVRVFLVATWLLLHLSRLLLVRPGRPPRSGLSPWLLFLAAASNQMIAFVLPNLLSASRRGRSLPFRATMRSLTRY